MWISITTTRPKDGVFDCYLKPARYTDIRDKRTVAYSNDFPVIHLIFLARGCLGGVRTFWYRGVCVQIWRGVGGVRV